MQLGRDLFYYRDQNGVEVHFVINRNSAIQLIEAKYAERPDPRKLNFRKVEQLFKLPVEKILACCTPEADMVKLKDYTILNPLNGFNNLW